MQPAFQPCTFTRQEATKMQMTILEEVLQHHIPIKSLLQHAFHLSMLQQDSTRRERVRWATV